MARGPSRRELFLQVGGTTDPLNTALKAGKSTLAEFGTSAENQLERVEEAFRKLAGSNPAAAARELEQSYTRSFQAIREQAEKALTLPKTSVGAISIDAGAAREAATAATQQALALREIAVAADRAAAATNGDSQATRVYALAAAAAAQGAEEHAAALRSQASVLENVQGQLNATGATAVRTNKQITSTSGQAKAGLQQLAYNFNDISIGIASNTPASLIFTQQIGQMTQAIGLMTGESKGLLGVLGNPWVLIAVSATTALIPLASALFEGADGADKLADKSLSLTDALGKEKFGTDEARKALIEYNAEKDKAQKKDALATEQALASAKARLLDAIATRQQTAARLAQVAGDVNPNDPLDDAQRGAQQKYQSQLAEQEARIKLLQDTIGNLNADAAINDAKAAADPLEGISQRYDKIRAAVERVARANNFARSTTEAWLTSINQQQKADEEAERKRQADARSAAKKKAPSLGDQVESQRGRDLLSSAQSYSGLRESRQSDAQALQALFAKANVNIDPKMVAWCAAFVNAVLATNGLPGTGSLSARSFLNYGTKTDKPESGDIVVLKRGSSTSEGHVGFYAGTDKKGQILVTGGNQGDAVSTQAFSRKDVLGFRRVSATASQDRSAERDADRKRAFEGQLDQAQERLYRAQSALADTTEERAAVSLERIKADEESRDRAITEQVNAKKLTDAEAAKLRALNKDAAALEATAVKREETRRIADRAAERERAMLDNQAELLRLQQGLATTAADRRRIALQLLDIEERQARAAADQRLRDAGPKGLSAWKAENSRIDAEHPLRVNQIDRDNQGPLANLREDLERTTGDMNDALERVAVDGFGRLEDAEARQLVHLLGLKGAFGDLAGGVLEDLARIGLKMLELQALDWLGLGQKKSSSGNWLSSVGSDALNIASIFGFAGGGQPAQGGGRRIAGPGSGTSDSILALLDGRDPILVSNGESINTAEATRRYWPLIDAMNKGKLPGFAAGGLVAPAGYTPRIPDIRSVPASSLARPGSAGSVQVDARFSVQPSPLFETKMEEVSIRTVGRAAEPIMAGAEQRTLRRAARPTLPGGFG